MGEPRIYLDANAGSRLRPCLAEAASRLMDSEIGNPSSIHHSGRRARALLRDARRSILQALGLPPTGKAHKLIFTSGGTEACNLLIFGFLGSLASLRLQAATTGKKVLGRIISSAIEHPAILEPLAELERCGFEVVRLLPESDGRVSPEMVIAETLRGADLLCLMTANNESGAIQPVAEIARSLRAAGYQGPIVSDYVQAMGKSTPEDDFHLSQLFSAGVDAVSLSAHKTGAPAGVGAIVISQQNQEVCRMFAPLTLGGLQEEGFRPGTENMLGIVAWGLAAEALLKDGAALPERLRMLTETLWDKLSDIPGILRLGPSNSQQRLPNTLMVRVQGLRGDDLVVSLDIHGVMTSTGSACSSGKQAISHVAKAMDLNDDEAREAFRLSLDWCTTEADILTASEIFHRVVELSRRDICQKQNSKLS